MVITIAFYRYRCRARKGTDAENVTVRKACLAQIKVHKALVKMSDEVEEVRSFVMIDDNHTSHQPEWVASRHSVNVLLDISSLDLFSLRSLDSYYFSPCIGSFPLKSILSVPHHLVFTSKQVFTFAFFSGNLQHPGSVVRDIVLDLYDDGLRGHALRKRTRQKMAEYQGGF